MLKTGGKTLQGTKADEETWFRQVLAANEHKLCRYIHSLLRNKEQAQDLAQDCFFKLWQNKDQDLRGRETQWLFTVARNGAYDMLRRRQTQHSKQDELGQALETEVKTPEQILEGKDHSEILQKIMEILNPQQREVVVLKFQQELSYKEISQITGFTTNHIGVLLHNVLGKMRDALAKLEGRG